MAKKHKVLQVAHHYRPAIWCRKESSPEKQDFHSVGYISWKRTWLNLVSPIAAEPLKEERNHISSAYANKEEEEEITHFRYILPKKMRTGIRAERLSCAFDKRL